MITARRAISHLLLLLLLARSLVPVGYMPAFGADGKVQIVICTGHGPATVSVDASKTPMGTQHGGSGHSADPHDICPFAPVLSHALAHVDMPALPVFVYREDKPVLQAVPALVAITPKPWFSQGPPILA
jgi:hypothetical protein